MVSVIISSLGCGARQLSGGHGGGGGGSGGVNGRIVGGVCIAHVVLVGAVPGSYVAWR